MRGSTWWGSAVGPPLSWLWFRWLWGDTVDTLITLGQQEGGPGHWLFKIKPIHFWWWRDGPRTSAAGRTSSPSPSPQRFLPRWFPSGSFRAASRAPSSPSLSWCCRNMSSYRLKNVSLRKNYYLFLSAPLKKKKAKNKNWKTKAAISISTKPERHISQTVGGQRFEGGLDTLMHSFQTVFSLFICNTAGCSSPSTPSEPGRAGRGLQVSTRVPQLDSCATRLSLLSLSLAYLLVLEGKRLSPFLNFKIHNLIGQVVYTSKRVHSADDTNEESWMWTKGIDSDIMEVPW